MTRSGEGVASGPWRRPARRDLLAGVGATLAGALAGCTGVTEQSFEATPVVLPEAARGELVLAETARESETVSRDGPAGSEVTITNHSAVYERGPARGTPTVLEQFVSSVNETPGSGSAISVTASEVGIGEASLDSLEGAPTVAGDQFSLIVPEGARDDGGIGLGETMVTIPGISVEREEVTYGGDDPGAFLPGQGGFFPGPGEYTFPGPGEYTSGDTSSAGGSSEYRVFLPGFPANWDTIDESPEETQRVEPGETIETTDTVFVFAGDVISAGGRGGDTFDPEKVFDAGVMLPLAGQPYGMGVLATPDASVAGQSANPLVGEGTAALLQRDAARQVLAGASLTDAETTEWLAGPQSIPETEYAPWEATLVDNGTDPEFFVGVLSGDDGPWGVFLTVARVTDEDHVVAVAGLTRPVGTVDGGTTAVEGSGWGMSPGAVGNQEGILSRAVRFTAETMERLERA